MSPVRAVAVAPRPPGPPGGPAGGSWSWSWSWSWPDALTAWREAGATVWLDAADPTPGEAADLEATLGLSDLPAVPLPGGSAYPRPRLQHFGAYSLLRLYVARPSGPGPGAPAGLPDLDPLLVLFGERFLLTLHGGPSPAVERLAEAVRAPGGDPGGGTVGLLRALLDESTDSLAAVLDGLAEGAAGVEEAAFTTGPGARRAVTRLAGLRRDLFVLRRIAVAQRSALLLLARDPHVASAARAGAAGAPRALSLDSALDRAVRLEQAIAVQHDLLAGARAAHRSWVAASLTQTTRTLLVAICLLSVPTLVTATYGMNFAHLPELGWAPGHLWAVAVALLLDGALWLAFRRHGWV